MIHRAWARSTGSDLHKYYDSYLRQYQRGIPEDTTEAALAAILSHAVSKVPYFAQFGSLPVVEAPFEALSALPLLDKNTIRERGRDLYSADLPKRRWYVNTSGGSTGEPVRLIQDLDYADRYAAVAMLYWHLLGHDFGQREVLLWGSERDILRDGAGLGAIARRYLRNSSVFNAFRMTEASMKDILSELNRRPPRLIRAYTQAMYELARFSQANEIPVRSQNGIVATAGTLHPFMREAIQEVFGCPVFNVYGSREISSIACEIPGYQGLWIAPWNCHVEIVDSRGLPVDDGVGGEIVITSLTNFAMPLIRYRIGDRGALMPRGSGPHPMASRVLENVTGRTVDAFRLHDGTIVDGEYLTHLVYFREWIRAFQVVQKREDWIQFRVVLEGNDYPSEEWEQILSGVRAVFGAECRVDLEIVDEIPALPTGKYRYTISEVE